MKKRVFVTIALSILLLLGGETAVEAAQTVQATLPTFNVTLNGQTNNNAYSKYPFLVYKDITYFPMTYYDSRLLGLQTAWSAEDGLKVTKQDGYFYEYLREVNNTKNKAKQTAEIVEGKITVNGKVVDNKTEEYPLLLFRDVTYFPLTWSFAVDEFGWEYHFSHAEGLVIDNSAVVQKNPEAWQGIIEWGGPVMGTGDLRIGVGFISPQEVRTVESLAQTSIMLYNFSAFDMEILPSDCQWEYQVYRMIDGQEHFVYSKKIPIYSGELPARNHAYTPFTAEYWKPPYAQKGIYKIMLNHPEHLSYQIEDNTVEQYLLREGRAPGLSFEGIVEVK